MLAQSVVQDFGGKARFVAENYGDSALAKRFGVTRYPAIFVDDVLVATPNDFGFYGKGETESGGRYAPLKTAETHKRFQGDLTRMIDLILAGKKEAARAQAAPAAAKEIAALPNVELKDLDGKPISRDALAGRVVLVEFWATWCPPCRGTLAWLGELKKRFGDRIAIVAVAVESDEAGVRKVAGDLKIPIAWAMGSPEIARAFGDLGGLPTLFLFDGSGRRVETFYGAPPTLHTAAEARIRSILPAS
jgi:thiol-disulfide isomerase/thioredoxin